MGIQKNRFRLLLDSRQVRQEKSTRELFFFYFIKDLKSSNDCLKKK